MPKSGETNRSSDLTGSTMSERILIEELFSPEYGTRLSARVLVEPTEERA